jgi:23S rRNA-/tRNA-specific pseudouridylate synthase
VERTLCGQFRNHTILKEYLALVHGSPSDETFDVDLPLEEHPVDKARMQIARRGGKDSHTAFEVGERFRNVSLLRCRPRTGRRHQIRVHLAHVGMPVVGDALYGGGSLFLSEFKRGYKAKADRPEKPIIDRVALHASSIEFEHVDGNRLRVEAPLPRDFERALKALRKWGA